MELVIANPRRKSRRSKTRTRSAGVTRRRRRRRTKPKGNSAMPRRRRSKSSPPRRTPRRRARRAGRRSFNPLGRFAPRGIIESTLGTAAGLIATPMLVRRLPAQLQTGAGGALAPFVVGALAYVALRRVAPKPAAAFAVGAFAAGAVAAYNRFRASSGSGGVAGLGSFASGPAPLILPDGTTLGDFGDDAEFVYDLDTETV